MEKISEESLATNDICKDICRLVVVDERYSATLEYSCKKLNESGVAIKFDGAKVQTNVNMYIEPTTGIGKAIKTVQCAMKKVNHALYRGEVYAKCEKGKFLLFMLKSNLFIN